MIAIGLCSMLYFMYMRAIRDHNRVAECARSTFIVGLEGI